MENPAKRVARDELEDVYKMLFPVVKNAKGEIMIDHVTGEPVRSEQIAPHLKDVFISILMRLDIVFVYTFYMTRELSDFFFRNNVWKTLARAWLGEQHFNDTVNALEPLVPSKKRMNFLWVILAHHVASNGGEKVGRTVRTKFYIYGIRPHLTAPKTIDIGQGLFKYHKEWIHTVVFIRSTWMDTDAWYIVVHIVFKHFGTAGSLLQAESDNIHMRYNHVALMKTVYEIMITFKGAKIGIQSKHITQKEKYYPPVRIRSTLM